MTNVPFINKITNELSKRKLKSDVVANAILDIAVGNDRLDNLIANGVTHSDLESLTIGGLTTEQTEALTAAYNNKAAIEKINGLKASAREIDNSLKTVVNVSDFEGGAKTSKAINLAINYAVENNITIVQADYGDYAFSQADLVDIPHWVSGGTRPCVYLPSNIHLFGQDKYKTRYIMDANENKSVSMIETNATDNTGVNLATLYGNRVDNDVFVGSEKEGINYKNGCTNTQVRYVHFENIENEAIDIDIPDYTTMYTINKFQYKISDCSFLNIGGTGIHNANWTLIDDCDFTNVAKKRYLGSKAGTSGSQGQGAIDCNGHMGIYNNCVFYSCVRAVHTYGVYPFTAHTHELNNAIVKNCLYSSDFIVEVDMSKSCGIISNLQYTSEYPNVRCQLITNKSRVEASPVVESTKTIEISKASFSTFIGVSLVLKGVKEYGDYIVNCLVDKRGNSSKAQAIALMGVTPEGIIIDGNTVYQSGTTHAVGATVPTTNAGGHHITNNTIIGGTHSIKPSKNCVVTGNICSEATDWGITVEGSGNIVSLNKTNKETRDLGTNNIIINNMQI